MRVILATAHGPEYADLAAITYPSLERYCKKHGYGLAYDPNRTDKDACKVALFQEIYATGEMTPDDVFCWVDTDAIVMNSDRRIESIVYEHMPRSVHYLIGCDVNGINSGVFLARFSPEASLFMAVYTACAVISGWADQEAIIQKSVQSPHKQIYREIPGKVFNCNLYDMKGWNLGEFGNYVNRYEVGDFVLHLAGIEEPTRSNTLKLYAEQAK